MAEGAGSSDSAPTEFSGGDFRRALGAFATGVTVVTTSGSDHPHAMTANAFSSVSLDPPLVLVCVSTMTVAADMLTRNCCFAINILSGEQQALSNYFASKDRPRGWDAFADIPHTTKVTGCPILEGVAGYVDCRLVATHEAGDHTIFIGEVVALDVDPDVPPLLFHHGRYRQVTD